MTIIATIQQRTWHDMTPRKTWAEVRTIVRASLLAYSNVVLTDGQVDEAIARAVESAWPRYLHRELWQCELDGYVDVITLPWVPSAVVNVSWKDVANDAALQTLPQNTYGRTIPGALWEVEGHQWRWLGTVNEFPASSTIGWAMQAEGKPLTAADEPTYCTVSNQYLVPLACAELLMALGSDSGMNRIASLQLAMALRQQSILALPATRPEARQTKQKIETCSSVVWRNWGMDGNTFSDFS